MEKLKSGIKLVYIGLDNKFFKNGNDYYFNLHDNQMGCVNETGEYHIWSIKEAFKSFVSPDVYSRMIL